MTGRNRYYNIRSKTRTNQLLSQIFKEKKIKTLKEIRGVEYGFFICPPMTLGDDEYYGSVFDFSSKREFKGLGAFSSAEAVENWLKIECKKLEE